MFVYIKILVGCAIAGFILATVFMTPGGGLAGALKGLMLGTVIAWGEWKSHRVVQVVSYVEPSGR